MFNTFVIKPMGFAKINFWKPFPRTTRHLQSLVPGTLPEHGGKPPKSWERHRTWKAHPISRCEKMLLGFLGG